MLVLYVLIYYIWHSYCNIIYMGKSLDNVLKAMEKRFSKESVRTLESAPIEIKRIPTGSKDLDEKIGGGYPVGRIIEILGGGSSW